MSDTTNCPFIFAIIIVHGILLSLPALIGIYTMVLYFEVSYIAAISVITIILSYIIYVSYTNIKKSIIHYRDMRYEL